MTASVIAGRITVLREITEDHDVVSILIEPDEMPLLEQLGLLRMAEDSAIRRAMEEEPGEADE